ncbi:unnamed protein product [Paramecium sonneborni]|uniref:Uncharacterized protein n=1 Tax=Paramecium sonneborni TaxID=65129 RepID=A0A8S1Q2P2_9CILI|nr:unnamed protein product [Paramecium sonneborni]
MNQLFEEQVNDENLILKKGIALNTLNCISTNGNPILQVNFKPKQETQILLRLLVQQIIESYFQNNQQYQYQYHWNTIFDVLQLLIQKFPILLPYLLKIYCSNFLEKYYSGIDSSKITSKISFLTLITSLQTHLIILYFIYVWIIQLFIGNLIMQLFLLHMILEDQQQGVIYDKVCQFSNILMNLLQIKSVAKICIQNINDPQNSFNFIKTYIEGIKNFDIKQHFIYKNQLFFILNTLNMLYSVAINLLLDKTEPIQVNSFQMSSAEINHQIFSNFMLHFQDRVKQNINIVKLLF